MLAHLPTGLARGAAGVPAQAVVGLPGAVGARVGQEQDLLLQQAPRSLRDLFSWN